MKVKWRSRQYFKRGVRNLVFLMGGGGVKGHLSSPKGETLG